MARNSGPGRFRSGLPPKLYNARGQELSFCVRVFIAELLNDGDNQSCASAPAKRADQKLPEQHRPAKSAPSKDDPYFTRVKY